MRLGPLTPDCFVAGQLGIKPRCWIGTGYRVMASVEQPEGTYQWQCQRRNGEIAQDQLSCAHFDSTAGHGNLLRYFVVEAACS